MVDRQACERRVYRLAVLLTGNPNAATKVIEAVLDAQPDLSRMDSAHMDRLTVLRSREVPQGQLVAEQVPEGLAAAVASLSQQQREAWVFSHVYQFGPRDLARAMDCSVSAAELHLCQAKSLMDKRLSASPEQAAAVLREYVTELEVPQFFYQRRQQRRKIRLITRLVIAVVLLIVMLGVAIWLYEYFTHGSGAPSEEVPSPPGQPQLEP